MDSAHPDPGGCGCGHHEHPVDVLSQEHQVILAVLEAVQEEARVLRAGQKIATEFWRDAFDFFATFVDTCHHGKEEDVLFPTMGRHGFPEQQGPIAVMREEHELGRTLVRRMRADVAGQDGAALAKDAQEYIAFLRDHIAKEDGILFPIAKNVLPPAAVQAVRDDFHRVEQDVVGEGTHCRFLGIARELCEQKGVVFDAIRDPGVPRGICH